MKPHGTSCGFTVVVCVLVVASIIVVMSFSSPTGLAVIEDSNALLVPAMDCDNATNDLSSNWLEPLMSAKDKAVLYKYLDQAHYYFETGSGGSTFQAAMRPNIKRMVAVESNPVWIQILRKSDVVHRAECVHKKLQLFFVDIKSKVSSRGFSYPEDRSKQYNWPVYSGAISLLAGSPWHPKPDTIFIDGRFRVACAIHAYFVASDDTIIMIHDYKRKPYRVVEKFLSKIEQEDQLAVFKKKKLSPEEEAELNTLLMQQLESKH